MRRAIITGITGQDGSHLAELLLDKGYRVYGLVRRHSSEQYPRLAGFRERVELIPGDLCDAPSLDCALEQIQPDESLQPRRDVVCRRQLGPAGAHHRNQRAWACCVCSRLTALLPQGTLLPGVHQRDVRPGKRSAQRETTPFHPQSLWRGQGLRTFPDGKLSGELWPVRVQWDFVQSRRAAARAGVRDAQDHAGGRRHQAGLRVQSCGWATSPPAATGATPAITSRRCGGCSSKSSPTTSSSAAARTTRSRTLSISPSATPASTGQRPCGGR